MVFGPLIGIAFMLFGGFLVNLASMPAAIRWLAYLSPIQWSFAGLAINQFAGRSFIPYCSEAHPFMHSAQFTITDAIASTVTVQLSCVRLCIYACVCCIFSHFWCSLLCSQRVESLCLEHNESHRRSSEEPPKLELVWNDLVNVWSLTSSPLRLPVRPAV